MAGYSRPHSGQIFDEMDQSFKFPVTLNSCVILVVKILPAPCCVLSHHLYFSLEPRIDSNARPGGRYSQALDSLEVRRRHFFPVRAPVSESSLRRSRPDDSDFL